MGGDPRPPLAVTVKCIQQITDFALLQSPDSRYAIFGDDAKYFTVGKEYKVAFVPVNSGNSVGDASKGTAAT